MLTRVRVPGAARDFSPSQLSMQTLFSITVSVQAPCAIACINSCAHVKKPKHRQPLPLLVYTNVLHTLVGMGSAALVAALPYPCKAIRISRKGKSSTKKKCRSWPYGFQRSRLVLFLGRHEQGPLKRDIKENQKC